MPFEPHFLLNFFLIKKTCIQVLKQKFSRRLNFIDFHGYFISCEKVQINVTNFLVYHEITCTILLNFLDIPFNYSLNFLIAVNEVKSKHLQIASSVINFQGKIFIFKKLQVPLKKLQILALFKETKKDLHEVF